MNSKLEVNFGTFDENLSSIKGNGGKVLNQNEKRLGCRCFQSKNKCEDFDEAMLIVQVRVGKF
jgi:hypothetical protein